MRISLSFFLLILTYALVKHGLQLPESTDELVLNGSMVDPAVEVLHDEQAQKVDVLINEELFTSYLYPDDLEKPVLYPVYAPGELLLTRGFPLSPRPYERIDHPHHVGIWFNYGDVNGLDFWNNSYRIDKEKQQHYGTIRHREVVRTESGQEGLPTVRTDWQNSAGEKLLDELTTFYFRQVQGDRIIDRVVTLTAQEESVRFTDNKEGMIAMRVARALEFPSDQPLALTDGQAKPSDQKMLHNEGVNGNYLSSEEVEGADVWGTRARWMKLYGQINEKPVAVAIIDHPENPGYPTYWHARTYGLFAANPLGQKVFSEGAEELNFSLDPGEEVTFRFRMVFSAADTLSVEQLDQLANDFEQVL